MKGVKELKARLKSVGNIRKITSTMELVAAAKMKRLQERAIRSRPYSDSIRELIGRVAAAAPSGASKLLGVPKKIEREVILVVGADRGLCGAFNANLSRAAVGRMKVCQEEGVEALVYTFGSRPKRFFEKTGARFAGANEIKVEKLGYRDVAVTMRSLVQEFLDRDIQRVSVVYTWFKSAVSFVPQTHVLLPFEKPEKVPPEVRYLMEPTPAKILDDLLPKSLEMALFSAVLESLASEYAARRAAMKNATDAADDMTDELQMEYNKARQAGITGDLLDIIAGAAAQS